MARKIANSDNGAGQLAAPQKAVVPAVDDDSDRPDWAGGKGGPPDKGQGGGKPDSAGTNKGDLYGDQLVLLRDLDPNDDPFDGDGGGNGEPELDANGNPILVGSNNEPIFYVDIDPSEDEEWEIPAADLPFVQEVDLGRANVARAPDKVMEKALGEALGKIHEATDVDTDAAGRIVCDGVAIDSPLENLALYRYLMTAGETANAANSVTESWASVEAFIATEPKLAALDDFDPSSLLAAAWAKEGHITLDAMLYENTTLGINEVSRNGSVAVTCFNFNDAAGEDYNYDREARYGDTWIRWYEDTDNDGNLDFVEATTVFDAVFNGKPWADSYVELSGDNLIVTSANEAGVNDFAQAADDARAVILFMHDNYGAIEVPPPDSDVLIG